VRVCEILFTSNRKEGRCGWGDSSGKRCGEAVLINLHAPAVRASVICRYETLVVKSKDIYSAKSASYKWGGGGQTR
jgi:hypothetical protein